MKAPHRTAAKRELALEEWPVSAARKAACAFTWAAINIEIGHIAVDLDFRTKAIARTGVIRDQVNKQDDPNASRLYVYARA